MPSTVDRGFRDFLAKLTPSSGETAAAKSHRQSINQCIRVRFRHESFLAHGVLWQRHVDLRV